jgi:hypothetical protein
MTRRFVLFLLLCLSAAAGAQEITHISYHPTATPSMLFSCQPFSRFGGSSSGVFVCTVSAAQSMNARIVRAAPDSDYLDSGTYLDSGSMVWPAGGAGIPNYTGNSSWGTSYNAANLIPASFINWSAPGAIGSAVPGPGIFNSLANSGAESPGSTFLGVGAGGPSPTPTLNDAVGDYALYSLTGSATQNVAIGHVAGYDITTGSQNVAIGESAMINNGTGSANTAVGWAAQGGCANPPCMLGAFPIGSENTAVGWESQFLLTTGAQNTAVGENSMSHLTTGSYNTTVGADSQSENTTGSFNTTYGHDSMTGATGYPAGAPSCDSGVFTGYSASYNTAIGEGAYCTATTGQYNTIVGWQAGLGLSSGSGNTYLGTYAGVSPTVANSNISGNNNTFLGYLSGPANSNQFSNSTAIGYNALVTASNQMVFGNASVAQILVPAGVSITSQDSGSPAITFSSNNVAITSSGVTGIPAAIVARIPSATFTSADTQPLTPFFITTAAGQYQICAQLSVKTAGSGKGTFSTVIAYTSDGAQADVALGAPVIVDNSGASNIGISDDKVPNCITAYLDNASTVSWEILAASPIDSPPTMRYSYTLMYLGQ